MILIDKVANNSVMRTMVQGYTTVVVPDSVILYEVIIRSDLNSSIISTPTTPGYLEAVNDAFSGSDCDNTMGYAIYYWHRLSFKGE